MKVALVHEDPSTPLRVITSISEVFTLGLSDRTFATVYKPIFFQVNKFTKEMREP